MLLSTLHWKWALKNLWRNPRRSLITGLAICSGYTGLLLFNGYFHRIERTLMSASLMSQGVGHVNIYKKDGIEKSFIKPNKYSLTPEDMQKVNAFLIPYQDQIEIQSGILFGVGLMGNGCRSIPFLMTGIDRRLRNWLFSNPELLKWNTPGNPVDTGQDYAKFKEGESCINITQDMSLLLNKKTLYENPSSLVKPWAPTDCDTPATLEKIAKDTSVQLLAKAFDNSITASEAQVSGLFRTGFIYTENMATTAPLELAQRLYNTPNFSKWVIFLKNEKSLSQWKKQIQPEFEEKLPEFEMLFYDNPRANTFYTGVVEFLTGMGGFFFIIVGMVISLSIGNSTSMNLMERSHEIGTLRSLGLIPSQIKLLLTMESFWLTFMSVMAGNIFTTMMVLFINQANIIFEPPGSSVKMQLMIHPQFYVAIILSALMFFLTLTVTYFLSGAISRKKVTELLTHV